MSGKQDFKSFKVWLYIRNACKRLCFRHVAQKVVPNRVLVSLAIYGNNSASRFTEWSRPFACAFHCVFVSFLQPICSFLSSQDPDSLQATIARPTTQPCRKVVVRRRPMKKPRMLNTAPCSPYTISPVPGTRPDRLTVRLLVPCARTWTTKLLGLAPPVVGNEQCAVVLDEGLLELVL